MKIIQEMVKIEQTKLLLKVQGYHRKPNRFWGILETAKQILKTSLINFVFRSPILYCSLDFLF